MSPHRILERRPPAGRPLSSIAASVLLALAVSGVLPAHGGTFRGPPTPLTGGGGPGAGGSPGPRTGGFVAAPTSWQTWWEYNKEPFLQLRESVHASTAAVTGGQGRPDTMAPSEVVKRDHVLPVLATLCERLPNRDVQTACLIAMAKIGADHAEFELLPILEARLARGNQEVRETAALALGLTRRPEVVPLLAELARDTRDGARAVGKESVDDRTRAFSIYALGLVAERSPDPDVQRQVVDVALEALEVEQRDIRVAALEALSVLRLDDTSARHKRLRWRVLEALWAFYDRDLGVGREVVQAHAPIAVARLLGRGDTGEHARAKARLAAELDTRSPRSPWIQQSAVLALGKLCERAETADEDDAFSELLARTAEDSKDQLTRFLSYVALAEIGGEANREFLIRAYQRGGKATVKPWAAIALGVLAFDARFSPHAMPPGGSSGIDVTIGRVLHRGFERVKNEECRSATAVALGLVGYRDAVPDLLREFEGNRLRDVLRGYIAIGLALMDATEAIPTLRAAVRDSERHPLVLAQSAVALGKLGDKEAPAILVKELGTRSGGPTLMRLAGIATAFRFIGDRTVVADLLELAKNEDLPKLSRAFVAAALGGVVDSNPLPWNATYSVGVNYRALVGTLSDGATGILDIL